VYEYDTADNFDKSDPGSSVGRAPALQTWGHRFDAW